MAANKGKNQQLLQAPSGSKIRQAVVMSAGPGARMLELERTGLARKGVEAWVGSEPVVWLTTDRSALMPITPGRHRVTYSVTGVEGRFWDIRVSQPANGTGGASDTLPPTNEQPDQGFFDINIP